MRLLVIAAAVLLAVPARADDLALRRVMLSAAGVGYFEYAGEADGAAPLALDVKRAAIDDVLASLVVFDAAGHVGTVTLPGEDAAHAAFADLPFGPAALASARDLLNALVGTEFSVRGPRPMTGRLLRAERMTEPSGTQGGVPRTRVTLLTADGVQQFVLEDAEAVQVADPGLRARIDRALATLHGSAAADLRRLTLRVPGAGRREVRVGYVAAAPLWKATYRLLLPDADGKPARLQAWAVLENDTASGLERCRSDAAIRQPGDVPPGAVSQLLRAAPGRAGGGAGPPPARRRYARLRRRRGAFRKSRADADADADGARRPAAARRARAGAGRDRGRANPRCSACPPR